VPLLLFTQGLLYFTFFHCEDSMTGAVVGPWFGCHGYLFQIAGFANHLICCMQACKLAPVIGPLSGKFEVLTGEC